MVLIKSIGFPTHRNITRDSSLSQLCHNMMFSLQTGERSGKGISSQPVFSTTSATRASQCKFSFHQPIFWRILEAEAELLTNLLHSLIFGQDIAGEVLEFFIVPEPDQLA